MKLSDINDPSLRQWAIDYTENKLAERKSKKGSTDDLRRAWSSYSEGDWAAFRELLDLRPRVREECKRSDFFRVMGLPDPAEAEANRPIEEGDIERAILRRIDLQPRRQINGQSYAAPYTFGLELAVLRDLLGERNPWPRATVEFIP